MIRNDFVSNSSSSSFIVEECLLFKIFNLTKEDIVNAIADLKGTTNGFVVFDMSIKKDVRKLHKDYDGLYSSWLAPKFKYNKEYKNAFEKFLQCMETIGIYEFKYTDINNLEKDVKNIKYKNFNTGKLEKIPKCFIESYKKIYTLCGAQTMLDVINNGYTRFVIHFQDNEVWLLKGMTEYGKDDYSKYNSSKTNKKCKESSWNSSSYSVMRFYEVLTKYFVDKGKIDLSNKELMKFWIVPDNHWWKRDKQYKNRKYFTKCQKYVSYDELADDMFNENSIPHEG